jgi:hypothetical protein
MLYRLGVAFLLFLVLIIVVWQRPFNGHSGWGERRPLRDIFRKDPTGFEQQNRPVTGEKDPEGLSVYYTGNGHNLTFWPEMARLETGHSQHILFMRKR